MVTGGGVPRRTVKNHKLHINFPMSRVVHTDVQLANMALRMVQCPEIESLEEGSSISRTVKMYYNTVLANCLTMYDWNFCGKQTALEELSVCPLPQYEWGYELPGDLLSIRWVRGGGRDAVDCVDLSRYEVVSGDVLCTDVPPPLHVRYTYRPPVEYYPAYFIDLFVHALAEELSAVFGYNLEGQRVFHERIWGRGGKYSEAVSVERSGGSDRAGRTWDAIGGSRAW